MTSTSEYPAQRLGRSPLPPLRAGARARALPADVWIVGALVLVATVIRVLVIDNQSFWMDEALTAYETRLPFGAMINVVLHVETTPPLYFVLIWIWAHIFGSGEVALRALSTIAGIALVPLAYLCGRELLSRTVGVLAAAFVAVNPFLIWYSQEARAYTLLAALSAASFLWFLRARADPSRRNVLWWVIFSALAIATHFFAGFLVAPEAIWLLWIARSRLVAVATGVLAVTQLAMLPFVFIDTGHGVSWIAHVPRTQRLSQAISEWGVSIIYRRVSTLDGLIAGAVVVCVGLALLWFGAGRVMRQRALVAGGLAAFVWIAPLALGVFGQDYFLSRNVMPAVVPVAVVLAAACLVPRARLVGGAFAVVLLGLFSYAAVRVQTDSQFQRPRWRQVAHALGPAPVTRAIFVSDGTTADPLKIYLPHVNWTEPQTQHVRIREVDVIGATKPLPLAPIRNTGPQSLGNPWSVLPPGWPVPRAVNPPGARLIARFRLDNWIIARFALAHPSPLSIFQLEGLASAYFRRTPNSMLIFFQHRGRAAGA